MLNVEITSYQAHISARSKNMRIETISFVKKHAAVLDISEPILVTQNGVPAYVIESYSDRKRRDDSIALLKLLSISEKDKQEGRTMSGNQLLARIINR